MYTFIKDLGVVKMTLQEGLMTLGVTREDKEWRIT